MSDSERAVPEAISPYPLDVVIGPDGTVVLIQAQFDLIAIRAAIDNLLAN